MPEWRNGRRTRLKIWRSYGRKGSSPFFGTTYPQVLMTFPIPAARKVFSFAVLQCSLHVFKEYSGSIAIVQFPSVCQRRNAILTLEAAAEIRKIAEAGSMGDPAHIHGGMFQKHSRILKTQFNNPLLRRLSVVKPHGPAQMFRQTP